MSVINDVFEAIADTLRTGMAGGRYTVTAYPDPTADLPSVQVWPASGDFVTYWSTFGSNGLAEMRVRVRVETVNQDGSTAAEEMARLLSAGGTGESFSIVDALMSDVRLGEVVENIHPESCFWDVDPEFYNHVGWIECRVVLRKQGANA